MDKKTTKRQSSTETKSALKAKAKKASKTSQISPAPQKPSRGEPISLADSNLAQFTSTLTAEATRQLWDTPEEDEAWRDL